jgi:RNA polymerase sigma-70 factor (ECF subfamily)
MASVAAARAKKIYDSPEELQLVRQAKAGSEAAFTALYNHHYARVCAVINRFLQCEDLSQWTANLALTKVWEKLPSFDEKSKFSTWVTRIAINEALMQKRHGNALRRANEVSLDSLMVSTGTHGTGPEHNKVPAKLVERLSLRDLDLEGLADRQVLDMAIKRMPAPYRDILHLRFWEGLTVEDIRQVLNLSAGKKVRLSAVKSRLLRARKLLIEQVEKNSRIPSQICQQSRILDVTAD